jgi:hypothetical protein
MGKISFKIYLVAGILTVLVFSSGILVGWVLDQNRLTTIQSQIDDLQINLQNLDLENSFYSSVENKSTCLLYITKAESLSKQTDELASRLNTFEDTNQFQLNSLNLLKKRYTLLNLGFWLQLVNLKKNCNYNATTILYFYPTKICDECVAQAIILDSLKKEMPEKLMIFAVDADLNLGIVDLLKKTYNITSFPTLVINEKDKIENFAGKEVLKKYL